MKIAVCFVCVWLACRCTNAQDYSHIDSLSILFEVYHMNGFDKRLFIGAYGGDSALYIKYTPARMMPQFIPRFKKSTSPYIYFFTRGHMLLDFGL